eukprot:TRINITY_DN4213_c0_g1_i2.p1 TRINITY_DN4213_c0_g1~~TRINITY_DN4213_c0_g1_i2.p1  ORF type:complete len:1772 (+),score=403.38 TRINITY_DN4213_c0_g1_i2:423-5318(+)
MSQLNLTVQNCVVTEGLDQAFTIYSEYSLVVTNTVFRGQQGTPLVVNGYSNLVAIDVTVTGQVVSVTSVFPGAILMAQDSDFPSGPTRSYLILRLNCTDNLILSTDDLMPGMVSVSDVTDNTLVIRDSVFVNNRRIIGNQTVPARYFLRAVCLSILEFHDYGAGSAVVSGTSFVGCSVDTSGAASVSTFILSGAALFLQFADSITINDCVFTDSLVTTHDANGIIGMEGSTVTLSSVTMTRNSVHGLAGVEGGMIWIRDSAVTMTSVNISGNAVSCDTEVVGGIISFNPGVYPVSVVDSIFNFNEIRAASVYGAVLRSLSFSGTFSNIQVLNNLAETQTTGLGAAIFFDQPQVGANLHDLLIRYNEFRSTTMLGDISGGGIAASGAASGLTLLRCQILDNALTALNSKSQGAGVYTLTSLPTVFINSTISRNIGGRSGGGVFASNVDLRNTEVSENSAISGGAIFINNVGTLASSAGTLIHDNSAFQGAAVFLSISASYRASNTVIRSNQANVEGGGVFASQGNVLVFDSTTFQNNSAQDGAAIAANFFSRVQISNTSFLDNTADRAGGSLQIGESSTLSLQACFFSGNRAGISGAAVSIERNSVLDEAWSTFSGNSAGEKGGAIFVGGSATSNLTGTTLTGNGAAAGGAVYLESGARLSISAVSVNDNTASGGGGGVYLTGTATATLSSSSFVGNQAADGAGLYCSASGNGKFASAPSAVVDATAIEWRSNVATGSGGALSLRQCAITLSNCAINSNMARTGGGVYSSVDCSMQAAQPCATTLASVLSGAAGLTQSNVTALWIGSGSVFFNNTATEKGGALYSAEAMGGFCLSEPASCARQASILPTVELSGVTFNENSAGISGGAVYWSQREPAGWATCVTSGATYPAQIGSMAFQLVWNVSIPSEVKADFFPKPYPSVELRDFYDKPYQNSEAFILQPRISSAPADVSLLNEGPINLGSNGLGTLEFRGISGPPPISGIRFSVEIEPYLGIPAASTVVSLAPCPPGDKVVPTGCQQCAAETYESDHVCKPCPPNVFCDGGLATAKPGYWLVTFRNSQNTTTVLPLSCRDGLCAGNNECANPYTGLLCTTCEEGYTMWEGKCQKCQAGTISGLGAGILVVYGLWILLRADLTFDFQAIIFTYQSFSLIITGTGLFSSNADTPLSVLTLSSATRSLVCDSSVDFYGQFLFRLVIVPILACTLPFTYHLLKFLVSKTDASIHDRWNKWEDAKRDQAVEAKEWVLTQADAYVVGPLTYFLTKTARFLSTHISCLNFLFKRRNSRAAVADAGEPQNFTEDADPHEWNDTIVLAKRPIDEKLAAVDKHLKKIYAETVKDNPGKMLVITVGYGIVFLYINILEGFITYIDCVEITPGKSVSTSSSAISCTTGEYKSYRAIFILFIVLYLLAIPTLYLWVLHGVHTSFNEVTGKAADTRVDDAKAALENSHLLGLHGVSHSGLLLRSEFSLRLSATLSKARPYVWIFWMIARRALIVVPAVLLRRDPAIRTLTLAFALFFLLCVHLYWGIFRNPLISARETVNLSALVLACVLIAYAQNQPGQVKTTENALVVVLLVPVFWELASIYVEHKKKKSPTPNVSGVAVVDAGDAVQMTFNKKRHTKGQLQDRFSNVPLS